MIMSFFDPDYNSRADYDMDGKVDDFEWGMFLHEMEEEDREIEDGQAFFAKEIASFEPKEDYIGLDLEQCTILDPDYIGNESLDELVSRYDIDLTEDDIQFYRDSQSTYVATGSMSNPKSSAAIASQPVKVNSSSLYGWNPSEAKSKSGEHEEPVEDLQSWIRHAPKEDLAKYRDRKWRYIGEWALAVGLVLLFLAGPITWICIGTDKPDVAGAWTVFCVILIGVILFFAFKLLGPSLGASERAYRSDVERIIKASNEKERKRAAK